MRANTKDLASGAIFAGIGLLYGAIAWQSLPIGRALSMGPGYFPTLISLILIGLGGAIAARSFLGGPDGSFGVVPWRGIACISTAVVFFALFFESIGIFPTVFLSTLMACAATSRFRIVETTVAGLVLATLCTVVFGYMLRLPVPLFAFPFGGS